MPSPSVHSDWGAVTFFMIYEWRAPISVHTPLGQGDAMLFINDGIATTGTGVNSIWVVRLHDIGIPKHFFSEDIRIYGNPMDGRGWDVQIPEDWKQ